MTQLGYKEKSEKLAYLLQLWQFYALQKKEFGLVQRLDEEIKKLTLAELPPEAPKPILEVK